MKESDKPEWMCPVEGCRYRRYHIGYCSHQLERLSNENRGEESGSQETG